MVARFMMAAIFAAAAWGQGIDRTFYLTHGESPANVQAVANMVRSIGGIRNVSVVSAQNAITVNGTAEEIAVADWLCHELSQPASGPAPHEYRMPQSDPPIVRVYILANVKTPQDLQQITNALRSVSDIQRAFPYNPLSALVVRGSADQIALADWLLHELNQSGPGQDTQDYPLPGARSEVAKVFYLKNTPTPQGMQELVNLTRSVADVQRFFPYNARSAIVARASAEQIALASWLVQQLDQPTRGQAVYEYRTTGPFLPVVRVFYLANTSTPQALMEMTTAVRSETGVQRVYPNNLQQALAIRGTADQVARAAQLIKERDK